MISLCERIFGKSIYDLTFNDLINFFSVEQEETGILEFKSGDIQIDDLYKEVAAFLNTEGGIIIVGAPKEQKQKIGGIEKKVCIGSLTPSILRGKDWIVQKIASNITPAPYRYKVHEITDNQNHYFIIEVEQSMTPPHQCADGKYYIRLETEAKPAPHGLIEALFFKRQTPILMAKINFDKLGDQRVKARVSIKNESRISGEKVEFIFDIWKVSHVRQLGRLKILRSKEGKFSIQERHEGILVRNLEIKFEIEINHLRKPFPFIVTYWAKDTELGYKFGVFDPVEHKVVEKYLSDEGQKIPFSEIASKFGLPYDIFQ